MLLGKTFNFMIRDGAIRVVDAAGRTRTYGDESPPRCTMRLHYAETAKIWYDRFQANRAKVAELYDERFCRMWELYLKSAEYNFRYQDLMVFQLQLAKQIDSVPITRDYMYRWERGRDAQAAHAAE